MENLEDLMKDLIENKENYSLEEALKILREAANTEAKAEADKVSADHAAVVSKLEEKIGERDATISSKDKELAGVVRSDVATAFKLPDTLAARLKGDTREELEADAKLLAESMAPGGPVGDVTNPAESSGAKTFTRAQVKAMSTAEIVANMPHIEAQFKAGTLNRV